MNKAVRISVPVSTREQATKALLCAFRPFGSIAGCERLAGLLVDWALADQGERRERLTQAIQARLKELDGHNWSDFVPEGDFPGLRTPTSGTMIHLYWRGGGRGREGMPPQVLVDFNRFPSSSRTMEITGALEHAGLLAYGVEGVVKVDDEEWGPATPITRRDVLVAQIEEARQLIRNWEDPSYLPEAHPRARESALAYHREAVALFEQRLAAYT